MKTILSLVLFSITFYSSACLNLSGTNIDGKTNIIDELFSLHEPTDYPSKHSIYSDLARIFDNYEDRNRDSDFYTDVAALYIYDGQYKRAIDLLNQNVIDKETNYNFCSNIGVAYELVGQLDSALYWTNKGIELKPDSHRNSEWIHIRILEIELAMQKNKNWLDKNSIFDFSVPIDSSFITFPDSLKMYNFIDELRFQLEERTFFVKPHHQDKLVAKLILILADAVAKEYDTHECKETYLLAAKYDTTLVETVNMRLAKINQIEINLGLEHYEYTDADGLTITNDSKKVEHVKSEEEKSKATHSNYKSQQPIEISWFWVVFSGYTLMFIFLFYKLFKKK